MNEFKKVSRLTSDEMIGIERGERKEEEMVEGMK